MSWWHWATPRILYCILISSFIANYLSRPIGFPFPFWYSRRRLGGSPTGGLGSHVTILSSPLSSNYGTLHVFTSLELCFRLSPSFPSFFLLIFILISVSLFPFSLLLRLSCMARRKLISVHTAYFLAFGTRSLHGSRSLSCQVKESPLDQTPTTATTATIRSKITNDTCKLLTSFRLLPVLLHSMHETVPSIMLINTFFGHINRNGTSHTVFAPAIIFDKALHRYNGIRKRIFIL